MIQPQNDIVSPWPTALDWLTQLALPLWAGAGFDHNRGCFCERLALDGSVIANVPRRLMVQARQIYVYATAAQHDWMPGAAELAATAAASMIRDYWRADVQDGWIFSVDDAGQPVDTRRDLYAHAFVLLGLAAAFQITGDLSYLDTADQTLQFLDREMRATEGGYVTVLPVTDGGLQQNPHMHLLEGLLALHDCDPSRGYDARARDIVTLFERRMFQKSDNILVEYFDAHWHPVAGERGRMFEPGHHCEWIWLLDRYRKITGFAAPPVAASLQAAVDAHGVSPNGLLWGEVTADGQVLNDLFRLWPCTEAIKAALATQVPAATAHTDRFLTLLHRHFLHPAHPGGWHDQIDSTGTPQTAFMPASSLYHIVCAFAERGLAEAKIAA